VDPWTDFVERRVLGQEGHLVFLHFEAAEPLPLLLLFAGVQQLQLVSELGNGERVLLLWRP